MPKFENNPFDMPRTFIFLLFAMIIARLIEVQFFLGFNDEICHKCEHEILTRERASAAVNGENCLSTLLLINHFCCQHEYRHRAGNFLVSPDYLTFSICPASDVFLFLFATAGIFPLNARAFLTFMMNNPWYGEEIINIFSFHTPP